MKIKRRIMNDIKGQPMQQKALAFAVYLKFKVGRDSIVKDFSINKIRKITGLSSTAINKYLPILFANGWASICGSSRKHLVINRMASSTNNRNVCVDKFCFNSFKDVYNSIRSFLAILIQARKDFIKRTIQIATNPQVGENCKAARKTVKRLVREGIIRDIKYKEYGLSYKRIAKELGNCARTAFRVMQYAINKKLVVKHNNVEQVFAPKVYYRHIIGYTFSTKNNLYCVHANTYAIPHGIISL